MNDDNVTIEFPGQKPIHTTLDGIKRAADRADGRAGGKTSSPQVAKDQLQSIVERIERLEEEKKSIADDIKDVYAEAKGNGYEVKALRRIVRLRRLDGPQKAAHAEVESILETYMQALGML
jgi:uncharacterized protein (UPF0335 family)